VRARHRYRRPDGRFAWSTHHRTRSKEIPGFLPHNGETLTGGSGNTRVMAINVERGRERESPFCRHTVFVLLLLLSPLRPPLALVAPIRRYAAAFRRTNERASERASERANGWMDGWITQRTTTRYRLYLSVFARRILLLSLSLSLSLSLALPLSRALSTHCSGWMSHDTPVFLLATPYRDVRRNFYRNRLTAAAYSSRSRSSARKAPEEAVRGHTSLARHVRTSRPPMAE